MSSHELELAKKETYESQARLERALDDLREPVHTTSVKAYDLVAKAKDPKRLVSDIVNQNRASAESYLRDTAQSFQNNVASVLKTSIDDARQSAGAMFNDVNRSASDSFRQMDEKPLLSAFPFLVCGMMLGRWLGMRYLQQVTGAAPVVQLPTTVPAPGESKRIA